jgi:hypothetical protein
MVEKYEEMIDAGSPAGGLKEGLMRRFRDYAKAVTAVSMVFRFSRYDVANATKA